MVTLIPLYFKEDKKVKQMIQLQNIANSIIYEQSNLVSQVLGINDINTNPGWLIRVPEDITYQGGKKTVKASENPTRLKGWEVTEFAKDFNKEGDFNETIDTRNTDDAIKFINSFRGFKIYPDVYNKRVLLRDKNNSVYLVNYPKKNERTHWSDVPWATNMGKDKIWKASKYIGDRNTVWFKNNFELSKKSKKTQNPKVTKNDQLTAELVLSAYRYWGGTDEKKLTNALNRITSITQYNKIDDTLKAVATKQGDTEYFTDEILFITRGKVILQPFTQAKESLGDDLAWDIYGRDFMIGGNKNKMVVYAALPQYIISDLGNDVATQGIAGLITSEMDNGEERDTVLRTLIENEICKWDETTNSCVFPDNRKINFKYGPGDKIRNNEKYHYYETEPEPESEEIKSTLSEYGGTPTGGKFQGYRLFADDEGNTYFRINGQIVNTVINGESVPMDKIQADMIDARNQKPDDKFGGMSMRQIKNRQRWGI